MASITVTVRTRGRHQCIFLLRLTALLVRWRRLTLALRVARHIGLWMKVGDGKRAQWTWTPLYIERILEAEVVHDGG